MFLFIEGSLRGTKKLNGPQFRMGSNVKIDETPTPGFEPESLPRKGSMIVRTTPHGHLLLFVSSNNFHCVHI